MAISIKTKRKETIKLLTEQDDGQPEGREVGALFALSANKRGGMLKSAVPTLVGHDKLGENGFDQTQTRHRLFDALTSAGVSSSALGVTTATPFSPALTAFNKKNQCAGDGR